jgi:tetratricopeptide (TPR) repeat protein
LPNWQVVDEHHITRAFKFPDFQKALDYGDKALVGSPRNLDILVMQASLARAKAHAQYIEQRIAAHEADSGRRKARATLINIIQIESRIAEYERKVSALEDAIRAEKDPALAERKIYQRDDLMRAIPALKNILARAKATEAPSRLKP